MPNPTPMLSLSPKNAQAERALTTLSQRDQILQRILGGESALQVAQDLMLSEKEVNEILTSGLEAAAQLMMEHATALQTKLYLQHEGLYRIALANIDGEETVEEDVAVQDENGNERWEKKKVTKSVTNINWFREASKELAAMQSLVLPFLKEAKPPAPTFNITVDRDDPLYKRIVGSHEDIDVWADD